MGRKRPADGAGVETARRRALCLAGVQAAKVRGYRMMRTFEGAAGGVVAPTGRTAGSAAELAKAE